jgi:NAD(P)-dependent dehydrogenase (short-subunit alcohol dehydrogenase family)
MTRAPTIVITGCSSGIGYHCAHGLHARGWRVFATARHNTDVERLRGEGLEALALDLADSASIETAVATVLERTGGRLDALFNNGAYGQPGAVEDLPRAALRAQLETNLLGWLELTNRVIPVMRAQGHGRIVQNSSLLGYVTLKWRGAYNASKFALEGLTDTLRLELAGSGIHVVLIQPGPIASRFRDNAVAAFERWIDTEASAHRDRYAAMRARRENRQKPMPFELGPEAVQDRLVHALESKRPKPRYPVTVPAHVFAVLRRLLPTRALDRLLARVSD